MKYEPQMIVFMILSIFWTIMSLVEWVQGSEEVALSWQVHWAWAIAFLALASTFYKGLDK